MARIVWLRSKKWMNGMAAHHPKTQANLKIESQKIAAAASNNLAQHQRYSQGHTKIVTEHPMMGDKYGDVDHYVHMRDTGNGEGEPAPYVIEFGGGKHNRTGKPIKGLFILTRAAGL